MEHLTDDELYRKYRSGNRAAFDALYERFRKPLYNYVRNSIHADRVDELYQDIWLKVVASIDRYNDKGRFRQWLFTCAHHLIVDEYRKNAKMSYTELPDIANEEKHQNDELNAAIQTALGELPLEQRQAFHLRHELGCSIAEIANIQGCPAESAKSRLRYAYGKLKTQLKQHQS